jgi:hypothetical protein
MIIATFATLVTLFIGLLINIHIDRQTAIGQKVYGENFLVIASAFAPVFVFVGILLSPFYS